MFELKAVYFGPNILCKSIRKTLIKILTDNTTATHGIKNMGSCKSVSCDNEMRKIWEWALKRGNFITAAHIPGVLNKCKTKGERETRPEWKPNELVFNDILNNFRIKPVTDLFALRINKQLPKFFPFRKDPKAEIIITFSVN